MRNLSLTTSDTVAVPSPTSKQRWSGTPTSLAPRHQSSEIDRFQITLPPEPNPTTTVTVTVTDGSASTVTVYRRSVAEKRAVAPRKLAFPSSLISSACSCVVKPTVRTVTQTATRTAGVTRAVSSSPLADAASNLPP